MLRPIVSSGLANLNDQRAVRLLERKLEALTQILRASAESDTAEALHEKLVDALLELFPQAEDVGVLVEDERSGASSACRCQRHPQPHDLGGRADRRDDDHGCEHGHDDGYDGYDGYDDRATAATQRSARSVATCGCRGRSSSTSYRTSAASCSAIRTTTTRPSARGWARRSSITAPTTGSYTSRASGRGSARKTSTCCGRSRPRPAWRSTRPASPRSSPAPGGEARSRPARRAADPALAAAGERTRGRRPRLRRPLRARVSDRRRLLRLHLARPLAPRPRGRRRRRQGDLGRAVHGAADQRVAVARADRAHAGPPAPPRQPGDRRARRRRHVRDAGLLHLRPREPQPRVHQRRPLRAAATPRRSRVPAPGRARAHAAARRDARPRGPARPASSCTRATR